MNEALVTPAMLRWARERLGLSPEQVAEKMKVRPKKLIAWENRQARPSFIQALKLANVLRVPVGYFYLDLPPDERSTLPDLRTLADLAPGQFSPDLLDVLNDALRKQEWYRDHLLNEGEQQLEFVGRFSVSDDAEAVAADMRAALNLDIAVAKDSGDWSAYLTALVRRSEDVGVTVLRSGVVGSNNNRALRVSEFRGFALVDDIAPLVFINSRDAVAAKIFTLIHELAHIWVGQAGISNQDPEHITASKQSVEKFCNAVAAEVLVPRDELLKRWVPGSSTGRQVAQLSERFLVSSMVVLRRAFDLERVDPAEFKELAANYASHRGSIPKSDGGNFHVTLAARNGRRLLMALVASALEGRTMYREAARLLSVRVPTLGAAAERLGLE